ncbi:MAG: hypothetical protein JXB15_09660 [Anaerolineales bacterium]|nr:hypothetical protein [Anaerolineales bacterium]
MPDIHLWPVEAARQDQKITLGFELEIPGSDRDRIWYELPAEHNAALTMSCDPFVLGSLFTAMRNGMNLIVHGQVSPTLLRNLDEFQQVWTVCKPESYTHINITADEERELPRPVNETAIAAFSGGVDSCFTAWRHHSGQAGRSQRNLRAAVMVHGFDITLRKKEDFERSVLRVKNMLDSLGILFIPMATNLKKQGVDWEDEHGCSIASCLALFQGEYSTGLIASTDAYPKLTIPWGSSPLTDHLLSSQAFEIVHDGAAYFRSDKVRWIAEWPEALQNLRVCLVGAEKDRNCCRCEKCTRTILSFRAWGLAKPACFEKDVSNSQIIGLKYFHPTLLNEYAAILRTARQNGQTGSWMRALQLSMILNRLRLPAQKALQLIGLKKPVHR